MKLIVVKSSDHVQWSILVYSTITFYSSYAPHPTLPPTPSPSSLLFSHYWDLLLGCIGRREKRKGE